MAAQPRMLLYGDPSSAKELAKQLQSSFQLDCVDSPTAILHSLQANDFDGVIFLDANRLHSAVLLEAGGILEQVPGGIVLLDPQLKILWANSRMKKLTGCKGSLTGQSFYDAFGTPEILGPDYCPFHTALATNAAAKSTLRVGEKTYFEVHTEPVCGTDIDSEGLLVVVVRDISVEVAQRQKLNAIYNAGLELGDLTPQEILDMSIDQRVELLKQKILHYTKDVLEFETVEIRMLDRQTSKLDVLLAVGMQDEALDRQLLAEPHGNGVTGFVAATGKSYLCEDTTIDPLYLSGALGARSSLTVPLILHDEVLGTFNVESPRPGAFDDNDLQFLELFSREVAMALNTLELLVAEKMTTATQSTELLMKQVAHPVDEILNDAAWILERYIGHEPHVCDRLQRILKHTRDIKQLIQRVGEEFTPNAQHSLQLPPKPVRPKLQGKRILVVDGDESVRSAAHELLGRFGCDVETATTGEDAFLMVRSFHYDTVIADIRLSDMTGFECFLQIRQIHEHLPVILMTGFGYDPTHSIVKARQHGLKSVLYKPFRLDQLLSEVETAVSAPSDVAHVAGA